MAILFLIVLILWLLSLIMLYTRMKQEIDTARNFADSAVSEMSKEVELMKNELDREREINKRASDEKKTLHSGDNRSDVDRATDILSNKKRN